MPFALDLPGRVENIPLSPKKCLNPVFEAISNSIHFVEEAQKGKDGKIDVYILRDTSQASLDGKPLLNQPVTGFRINDNGIGFTDENFESFRTSDTRRKADRGGKGVGRLLWLKAFQEAHVESRFRVNGTTRFRTFDFQLTQERTGIHSVEGPMTLRTLLERITSHILHHAQFIEEKRLAMK